MSSKPIRPDIPLSIASQALASLCTAIEDDLEPTEAVALSFSGMRAQLADQVDACVLFNGSIVKEIERAKETYRAWREYAARLEKAHEVFKASVKETVETNADVPYKGAIGSIAVQKSPPKVVTQFAETDLDRAVVDLFGISDKYVRTKTVYSLDLKALKEDLGNGVDIPWATLEQGTHVRFREAPVARAKAVTPSKLAGAVHE